jgi:hypothetical protein
MRKWVEKAVSSFMKFSPLGAPKARKADLDAGVSASPKIESNQPGQTHAFKPFDGSAGACSC